MKKFGVLFLFGISLLLASCGDVGSAKNIEDSQVDGMAGSQVHFRNAKVVKLPFLVPR